MAWIYPFRAGTVVPSSSTHEYDSDGPACGDGGGCSFFLSPPFATAVARRQRGVAALLDEERAARRLAEDRIRVLEREIADLASPSLSLSTSSSSRARLDAIASREEASAERERILVRREEALVNSEERAARRLAEDRIRVLEREIADLAYSSSSSLSSSRARLDAIASREEASAERERILVRREEALVESETNVPRLRRRESEERRIVEAALVEARLEMDSLAAKRTSRFAAELEVARMRAERSLGEERRKREVAEEEAGRLRARIGVGDGALADDEDDEEDDEDETNSLEAALSNKVSTNDASFAYDFEAIRPSSNKKRSSDGCGGGGEITGQMIAWGAMAALLGPATPNGKGDATNTDKNLWSDDGDEDMISLPDIDCGDSDDVDRPSTVVGDDDDHDVSPRDTNNCTNASSDSDGARGTERPSAKNLWPGEDGDAEDIISLPDDDNSCNDHCGDDHDNASPRNANYDANAKSDDDGDCDHSIPSLYDDDDEDTFSVDKLDTASLEEWGDAAGLPSAAIAPHPPRQSPIDVTFVDLAAIRPPKVASVANEIRTTPRHDDDDDSEDEYSVPSLLQTSDGTEDYVDTEFNNFLVASACPFSSSYPTPTTSARSSSRDYNTSARESNKHKDLAGSVIAWGALAALVGGSGGVGRKQRALPSSSVENLWLDYDTRKPCM